MKKIFSLLFLIGIFIQLSATDDDFNCLIKDERGIIREHNLDFIKLKLNLKFDTKNANIFGIANYTFKPLRTNVKDIFLDAPNIEIKEVLVNFEKKKFEKTKEGIKIILTEDLDWKKEYNLKISYQTQPQKGMYFIGWNDKTNRSRKQIWTQGQGIDNRHWIPSYDGVNDKLKTETIIEFETGYEVISNGILQSKTKNNNNTTTWHYVLNKPHALYLMMVAIGKYEHKDYKSKTGVTTEQYYYPDKKDAEKFTYAHTNAMMNWFHEELKVPYQWEIYRNIPVQDFMYGAMENTSSTIYTDFYLQNEKESSERNYVGTNAHELAHQWFGDYVTEWSGSSHWLHESFATHYSKQFLRTIYGEAQYEWQCRKEQMSALSASKKNNYPIGYTNSGSSRHYSKGSFVLDMLRYVVGEEEYKKTITQYLKDNALGMVDTHEFQMAFMKTLGINLDWFFNQWIYKGGEPKYEVAYKTKLTKTVFQVKQIQEQNDLVGLFKMPIVFQVHYKDGSFDEVKKWIEDEEHFVSVPNKSMKKVDYVLFDPGSKVLKKVNFVKTYKSLISQAKKAKHFIDRYDAIDGLSEFADSKKRDDLIEIYLEEDFRAIKQNILIQLKDDVNPKTEQLYVYAIAEKDTKVRRTAIDNLQMNSKRYIKFYEEMLNDKSYINAEKALIKLCKIFPLKQEEYLNRTRYLSKEKNSFRITWLKLSYGKNKQLYSELVDFASESFDFRTRIKALNALGEIKYYDNNYMMNVVNAYLSFNRRLKKPASKQLRSFLENKETGVLTASYIQNHKWFPYQKEKLDKLLIEYGRMKYKKK